MPKPTPFHRPRSIALAALAALAPLSPPARALDVTWTGGAPIFFWYDASNRFNPSGEVADALDCAGINNAGRLTCDTLSFWGYAGNWGGKLPGAGDDVHIVSTAQVNVEMWISPVRGQTAPQTSVVYNSINQGGGGSLWLANGQSLHTVGASIDRLQLGGKILVDGQGTINQVANVNGAVFPTAGVIGGSGSTLVHAGSGFGITDSQRVTFDGSASAVASFTLYDDAVLVNRGNLTGGLTLNNYGSTHGGNGYSAVRSFENLGALSLSTASGLAPRIEIDVLLRNQSSIDIGANGYLYAVAGGDHGGGASFAGGAQSQMVFAGYHRFAAGSTIASSGTVYFGGAAVEDLPNLPYTDAWGFYNDVAGSYRAGKTMLLNNAVFSSLADPGDLTATGSRAYFNGPARVQVSSATLNNGALYGTAAVDVAGPLLVHGGGGIGTAGGLHALGGITFDGGGTTIIGFYGAATRVENHVLAVLKSGALQLIPQATFANLAGASFDLQGDFSIGGGGGATPSLFDNAGVFTKSAGSGVATITTPFNNSGSVIVQSGTLRLLGGGTHSGSFDQATSLDFGGAHVFTGNTTLGADVGFYGDATLTVKAGATLTSLSQTFYERAPAGTVALVNHGSFTHLGTGWSHVDSVTNTGSMTLTDGILATADVSNRGGSLGIGGALNAATLVNDGGLLTTSAAGQADLGQLSNSNSGVIRNVGTMSVLSVANDAGSSLVNSGSFTIGYSDTPLQLQNLGSITNTASGSFSLRNSTFFAGQFHNDGQFINQGGSVWLRSGDTMDGQGSLLQYDGLTRVDGHLVQAGGVDIEGGALAGLGQISGPVTVGASGRITPGNSPGTLTINGDVHFLSQYGADPSLPQLVIEVVNPVVHDRLAVNGAVSFDSMGFNNVHAVTIKWQSTGLPDLDDAGMTWLNASLGISNDDSITYFVDGLGAEWQAQSVSDGSSLSLSFRNSLAYQIQALGANAYNWQNDGSVQIATGDYAYNLANGYINNGSISNGGRFYNRAGAALYNITAGTLTNGPSAFMQNRGALANDGLIDNAGTFVNHADGTFSSGNDYGNGGPVAQVTNRSGASISNNGNWFNGGNSTLRNQGSFVNNASLQNNGTINNDGGSFQVSGAGRVQGNGIYLQGNGGSTVVDGQLDQYAVSLQGGTLGGTGVVRAQGGYVNVGGNWVHGVAVNGATIEPGHGQGGLLTIDGDLSSIGDQAPTLVIDIAGKGISGQLAVTGQAAFSGNLVFNLVGGYLPKPGDSFTWLTAGSGSFGYGGVSLQIVAADGSTTLLDGPNWQWVGADDRRGYLTFTLDGQVEYAIWNIDGSTDTLSFSDTLQAVPEPQTWMLLLAGLGLMLRRLPRGPKPEATRP